MLTIIYNKGEMLMNIIENLLEKNKIPFYLNVQLTNNCIFKCKHCYLSPEIATDELDVEIFQKLLKEFREKGATYLRISGGEPLMVKNFLDYYNIAFDLGYFIEIMTNGFCLNESHFKTFKNKPPYRITLSLYGINNETYKSFCGIQFNAWDKIERNIEILNQENIKTRFNIILNRIIYDDNLCKIKKFVDTCGKYNLFRTIQCDVDSNNKELSLNLTAEEEINSYFIFCDANIKLAKKSKIAQTKYCMAGVNTVYINSKAQLYLCPALFKYSSNQLFDNFYNEWTTLSQNINGLIRTDYECRSCDLWGWCGMCGPNFHAYMKNNILNDYCIKQRQIFNYLYRSKDMINANSQFCLTTKYDEILLGTKCLVLPKNSEICHTSTASLLNETAYKILEFIKRDLTYSEIVSEFIMLFDGIENSEITAIEKDVRKIIHEFIKIGMVINRE